MDELCFQRAMFRIPPSIITPPGSPARFSTVNETELITFAPSRVTVLGAMHPTPQDGTTSGSGLEGAKVDPVLPESAKTKKPRVPAVEAVVKKIFQVVEVAEPQPLGTARQIPLDLESKSRTSSFTTLAPLLSVAIAEVSPFSPLSKSLGVSNRDE